MTCAVARSLSILILAVCGAWAQPPARPLEFEVASIKPADPDARGSSLMDDPAENLTVTNTNLRTIITFAWDIRDFQLSGGPGWVGTENYDIVAKTARNGGAADTPDPRTMSDQQRKTRSDQMRERVRMLLASRFGLVVHHETKEQTIYLLTVAKGGPKLKAVTTPGNRQGTVGGRGRSQGLAATIEMLTHTLSAATGRPVVDKTGLTGKYDYVLEWTPDVIGATQNNDAAAPVTGPTIFTALQEQLGLRLQSAKGPVDTIVIDDVHRPSAN